MLIKNKATEAYLELVKIGIGTSENNFDFSKLQDAEWQDVVKESIAQSTCLMCFDALKSVNLKPNNEVYNAWFLKATKNLVANTKLFEEQKELDAILRQNNIPYVILKGSSSAAYYPDMNKRAFGDVDFLVSEQNLQTAIDILVSNGYELQKERNDIHYEFHKNGCRFELHKSVAGTQHNKAGAVFAKNLETVIDNAITMGKYVRPNDFHHAIIILLHSIHHIFYQGIGMRHMCDWACFVDKTRYESFWEERLIPLLKDTGTFTFACGLTMASVKYLNICKPNWCVEVSEDISDTIMEQIFLSGNFGRKNISKKLLYMMPTNSKKLTVWSKIKVLFKTLNRTNKYICPTIKRFPIIYPFVVTYRILKFSILSILGKKPSLIKASKDADERSAIIMKYQLYKVEDDK